MAELQTSTEEQATQRAQRKQQGTKTEATKAQKATGTAASKPSSNIVAKKAQPVLMRAEVERMIDLGLGRGVDSTDPKPWYNKSAFQVRRVTPESVIGTEEGGSLQSYEREVTSLTSHQVNLKAAVAVPQAPVQVGIDAEASRSVTSTRKAVGKKVINRTISFRSDFEDASLYGTPVASESFDWISHLDSDWSVADTQGEYYTFEERLSMWIIDRMLYRQQKRAQEAVAAGKDPGEPKFALDDATYIADPLSVMSNFIQVADTEERRQIVQDCSDFVAHFRITHYVCAVELGAAEYRVFSEKEFTKRLGAGGAFGLEQLAEVSVSETSSWKKTKKASNLRRIGKIAGDGRVSRGTLDEAVVGIRVQPISSLIKQPYLSLALRKAVINYMDQQGDSTSGPFVVTCEGTRALYWSVDDTNYTIYATTDVRNASLFFIIPNDEGNNAYEFHIAYKGNNQPLLKKQDTQKPQHSTEQISRYLSAPLTICGVNAGPLQLKHHVLEESRLELENRVGKDKGPVNPQNWVNGQEVFFVRCARRRFKRDGYICVKQQRRGGEDEWITACVPFKFLHNEQDISMIFRLLPASYRGQQSKDVSATPTDESTPGSREDKFEQELELLAKGFAPEKFRAPVRQRSQKRILPADSENAERQMTRRRASDTSAFAISGGETSNLQL